MQKTKNLEQESKETFFSFLLTEQLMKSIEHHPTIIAIPKKQIQTKDLGAVFKDGARKKKISESFVLSYFNPFLGVQTIKAERTFVFDSYAEFVTESASAMRSTLPVFKYITAPLLKRQAQQALKRYAASITSPPDTPSIDIIAVSSRS